MIWPSKMSHSFTQTVVGYLCMFHIIKTERLAAKRKVKLIFAGADRFSGTGIVERLEIHWRRVYSETVWWLDLTDPDPQRSVRHWEELCLCRVVCISRVQSCARPQDARQTRVTRSRCSCRISWKTISDVIEWFRIERREFTDRRR